MKFSEVHSIDKALSITSIRYRGTWRDSTRQSSLWLDSIIRQLAFDLTNPLDRSGPMPFFTMTGTSI